MPNKNPIWGIAVAAFMFVASAGAASAQFMLVDFDFNNDAFAQVTGPTSTPIGHAEFCKTHGDECGPTSRREAPSNSPMRFGNNWSERITA
jgi:predicted transglutaminase-like cysteine proteinase